MMGCFRRLVNELGLKEIPLLGRCYTWSNERETPTLVKLDGVLCTVDWEALYLECILQSQATKLSDHRSLLLSLKEGVPGKKRFHFESSWTAPVTMTCLLKCISVKLKRLTRVLQSWSHKKVAQISNQLRVACEILHGLEIAQDLCHLSPEEEWLRCKTKRHYLFLASLERVIDHLRSRIWFLKGSDANTTPFHRQMMVRSRHTLVMVQKTNKCRSWLGLEIPVHHNARALLITLWILILAMVTTHFYGWTSGYLGAPLRIWHQMWSLKHLRNFGSDRLQRPSKINEGQKKYKNDSWRLDCLDTLCDIVQDFLLSPWGLT
jgi:hypothetical protein